jgi:hypothetical protein
MRLLFPLDRKMVFESWPGEWSSGKAAVSHWKDRGYVTTMRLVSAVQVGGAVAQTRFPVTRAASGEVPLASILSPLALVSDSAFHWEHLSELLVCPTLATHESSAGPLHSSVDPIYAPVQPVPEFSWCPLDLSTEGVWYRERVTNLVAAATHYEDRVQLVQHGLRALKVHRSNYTATHPEPKQLQLLWLEFPPEHWDESRDSGFMNFMVPPTACIHPNSSMTEEQLVIATDFVQELVDLGVLVPVFVLTNGPLFVLKKAGQPGQWRVLPDMKSGGQNSGVSNDPVFLNRTSHILDQLYDGGYSAVVDASK